MSFEDTIKEVEKKIKSIHIPSKNKIEFLDSLNTELIRLIALNYRRMGKGHKSTPMPPWRSKQKVGVAKDGTEIFTRLAAGTTHIPYFDHFGKPNIVHCNIGDEDKWGWVSNPYSLSYEQLEIMMEEMKKYGLKFDISGESNYVPGRTFQIRFRKSKSKGKKKSLS